MFKTGHVILYHPIRLNVNFCLSNIRNYLPILRYMKRSDSYARGQSSPILLVNIRYTGVPPFWYIQIYYQRLNENNWLNFFLKESKNLFSYQSKFCFIFRVYRPGIQGSIWVIVNHFVIRYVSVVSYYSLSLFTCELSNQNKE